MQLKPEYPGAVAAWLENHSAPGSRKDKNQLTLHHTEGATAAGAFHTFLASVAPHRISVHFIIEQDGTVYQLVPIADIAWHASQVNAHSVGIEHVAISPEGAAILSQQHGRIIQPVPITEAQYRASAGLVAWLCKTLGLPIDRAHVRTHAEASPADGHAGCCTFALDPDRVVREALAV